MLLNWIAALLLAVPSSVVLRWKAVEGAVLYDLEIASDPQFKDIVLSVRIAQNGYRWEASPEKPHWFRARGLDKEERAGPWSESKEIAAVFVAPAVKPTRGQTVALDSRVDLDFEPSPLFSTYRLEVALDDKFKDLVLDKTQEAPPFVFVPKSAGTYYYRMTGVADGGKTTAPTSAGTLVVTFPGPESADSEPSELSWKPCRGCVQYRVQVSADPKWKALLLDERTKQTKLAFKTDAPGTYAWRVFGEDAGGRRSAPSAVRSFTVAAVEKPTTKPAEVDPPEEEIVHGYAGVGHALHWNFSSTFSPAARIDFGIGFNLGPGRFIAYLSIGLDVMFPRAEFATAGFTPDLLLFPTNMILGYQLHAGPWRFRFGAFPAFNPAYIVIALPMTLTSVFGLGFGVGGLVTWGYSFGRVQVFSDLRVSYAPLTAGGVRIQTGGLIFGVGFWYEP